MGAGAGKVDPNVISKAHFKEGVVLGEGGFGKVHACKRIVPDESDQAWYAIKTLCKKTAFKTNNVKMIFNERNLLASLAHHKNPWIANIHHSFQDQDNCYLALTCALGGDLQFHLNKQKKFPENRVKMYTAGMILALDFLHENNILHRDLKPANILVDEDGYVCLTDLGISKEMDANKMCKNTSGTRSYMAPEIFSEETHGVPSDWYSLGVCCFQFLCGKIPKANRANRTGTVVSDEAPDRIRAAMGTDLSEECKDFVSGLLNPTPADRLGCNDVKELTGHPWYKDFDWEAFKSKKMPADFKPSIGGANCDTGDENIMDMFGGADSAAKKNTLTEEQQNVFSVYDWNTCDANREYTPISAP